MEKATYSVNKVQEAAKLVKQFNWSYKELNCGEGILALEKLFQKLYDLTGDYNFLIRSMLMMPSACSSISSAKPKRPRHSELVNLLLKMS